MRMGTVHSTLHRFEKSDYENGYSAQYNRFEKSDYENGFCTQYTV